MLSCITTCFNKRKYDNLDLDKIENFIPPIISGKVVKVYDGDTITVVSEIPGLKNSPIYKFSLRLNGIDAPEIKGKDEDEKTAAIAAKEELSKLILNEIIYIKNKKIEKYGRILCDIYKENMHINNYMIEKRYAVPYNGKTKKVPTSWKEYYRSGNY